MRRPTPRRVPAASRRSCVAWPLVARLPWVGIGDAVTAAVIHGCRTTPVVTGIVPSVRVKRANGWRSGWNDSCPWNTSTWSSRCSGPNPLRCTIPSAVRSPLSSASQTLLRLAADRNDWGRQIGVTALLHTWGKSSCFIPPALRRHRRRTEPDGRHWIAARRGYLLPVKVAGPAVPVANSVSSHGEFRVRSRGRSLVLGRMNLIALEVE